MLILSVSYVALQSTVYSLLDKMVIDRLNEAAIEPKPTSNGEGGHGVSSEPPQQLSEAVVFFDFHQERDTFRNKIMEILEDLDETSYNNNGKPWKSSRILSVNPFFFLFSTFFSFFHFFHFSIFFIFLF